MDSAGRTLVMGDDGSEAADVAWLHPWQPGSPRVLLTDRGGVEVVHLTADGDPRVVLHSMGSAGLLVIGHRGRGILKALTLGSTADWLLHRTPAPLVIIRSARPTRRVLLCVDGSPDAREATRVLAAMPWITGVTVLVLSVDDGRIRPHAAIEQAQALLLAAGAVPQPSIRESLRHSVSFNVRSTVLEVLERNRLEREPVDLHAPCSVLVARAGEAAGQGR